MLKISKVRDGATEGAKGRGELKGSALRPASGKLQTGYLVIGPIPF